MTIKSDPDGAKVNGRYRAYGSTPLTVMLRPGHRYRLTLTKPGFAPTTTHYYVEVVDSQTVQVALKKMGETKGRTAPASSPTTAPPKNARANWWKLGR